MYWPSFPEAPTIQIFSIAMLYCLSTGLSNLFHPAPDDFFYQLLRQRVFRGEVQRRGGRFNPGQVCGQRLDQGWAHGVQGTVVLLGRDSYQVFSQSEDWDFVADALGAFRSGGANNAPDAVLNPTAHLPATRRVTVDRYLVMSIVAGSSPDV